MAFTNTPPQPAAAPADETRAAAQPRRALAQAKLYVVGRETEPGHSVHEPIDDKVLMLRFQEHGDYAAFEELFRRHRDGFVAFLARLSGNQAIAEDISQQVWMKLIEVATGGRYTNQKNASFTTYLYTLGRNKYFDEYHRKHGESRKESLEENGNSHRAQQVASENPEEDAGREEIIGALDRAVHALPPEQREVIALWANGVELKIVAEITGVSWNTVLSRKKYGIKKLRVALVESGIG